MRRPSRSRCTPTTRAVARSCGASAAAARRRHARPASKPWRRRSSSSRCATPTTPGPRASSPRSSPPSTSSPDAALCFGRALVVGTDGRPTGERWTDLAAGRHEGAALQSLLYAANPIPTSSVVMRRGALERAGGFESPVRLAEDWDLWLRLATRGEPFVCAPDALVRYRRHAGGLTADVAALARCQLELHRAHGDLVEPERARARARRRRGRPAIRDARRRASAAPASRPLPPLTKPPCARDPRRRCQRCCPTGTPTAADEAALRPRPAAAVPALLPHRDSYRR